VTADIVRPEEGPGVPGRAGEGNLEGQHIPVNIGIAGEFDGITVVAPSRPSAERLPTKSAFLAAGVIIKIQHLQVGHAGQASGVGILLPIEPPEIDSLLFARQMGKTVEGIEIMLVRRIEGNRLSGGGVLPHRAGKIRICFLVGLEAAGGMIVERDMQPLVVEPLQQRRRIGNEGAVPGVARPCVDIGNARMVKMPVHIHHDVVERKPMLVVLLDDLFEFVGRIGPVAGVPDADGIFARQRDRASRGRQAAESRPVIEAVTEKIPIEGAVRRPRQDPIPGKQRGRGVVEKIPAVTRKNALAQRHGAFQPIHGSNGATEVLRGRHAGFPDDPIRSFFDFGLEVIG
jgi:hypothetical protein